MTEQTHLTPTLDSPWEERGFVVPDPRLPGGEGGALVRAGEVGDAPFMTDTRNMIAETAERLFADHLDQTTREAAEEGTWPAALWEAVAANGLDRVLVPEEAGGFGGDWGDAFVILRAAGKHAAPVPLAETIGASWLLTQAGLDAPQGIVTFAESGTLAIEPCR